MAISANGTKLENLVNPQVLADMISAELEKKIALAPLAEIDRELVGRAGNTLTMPKYGYIGDAKDVAEGTDIEISQMSTSTTEVTIKKAGKGVEITDEAALSGYGDPVGEARKQLTMSIANKVDNDLFEALAGATLTSTATGGIKVADIFTARAKFGENVNEPAVLVIPSDYYAGLATDIVGLENTDRVLIGGVVGKVAGVQVYVSNKVTTGTAYLLRTGALGIALKRDVQVETDRDIIAKLTVITADEHYVAYLKDESKAVKITIS